MLTLYVLRYFHTVLLQWEKESVWTQWNWDDEHKLSRITSRLKNTNHYNLIRDICTSIRELICNSTISMQQYRKFLKSLDLQLITFSKDIEIRFNSVLKLLDQVIRDYILVLKFCNLLCSRSKECQTFWQRHRRYKRALEAYEIAQNPREHAPSTETEAHAANLLRGARTQPLSPPKQPKYPKEMDIRDALMDPQFLFVMAILSDYIRLFDEHGKKTGSVEWIKCMTENELVVIEQTLIRWKSQSLDDPKSPMFSAVCAALQKRGVWSNVNVCNKSGAHLQCVCVTATHRTNGSITVRVGVLSLL